MRLKVEFEVEIEDGIATDEQIEEWLRFNLNDNGRMDSNNPLAHEIVKPYGWSFCWDML